MSTGGIGTLGCPVLSSSGSSKEMSVSATSRRLEPSCSNPHLGGGRAGLGYEAALAHRHVDISAGDVITQIDCTPVPDVSTLADLVATRHPNDRVKVTVTHPNGTTSTDARRARHARLIASGSPAGSTPAAALSTRQRFRRRLRDHRRGHLHQCGRNRTIHCRQTRSTLEPVTQESE